MPACPTSQNRKDTAQLRCQHVQHHRTVHTSDYDTTEWISQALTPSTSLCRCHPYPILSSYVIHSYNLTILVPFCSHECWYSCNQRQQWIGNPVDNGQWTQNGNKLIVGNTKSTASLILNTHSKWLASKAHQHRTYCAVLVNWHLEGI